MPHLIGRAGASMVLINPTDVAGVAGLRRGGQAFRAEHADDTARMALGQEPAGRPVRLTGLGNVRYKPTSYRKDRP